MSIHWTLVAGFLYAEIGVILLLLVPFISSKYEIIPFVLRIIISFINLSLKLGCGTKYSEVV